MLEVSGVSLGWATPVGSSPASVPRRSDMPWRMVTGSTSLFERHDDDGQPIDGFGAQGFDARGAVHRRLDGPGDDLLDLLGRKARRLGLDRHLRRNELREDVEWGPQCEEDAGNEPGHR